MEWPVVLAVGVAGGALLWPLVRAIGWSAKRLRTLRRPVEHLRFWLAFGFTPSADPDVQSMLRGVVEQRLTYLRAHVLHSKREFQQICDGYPHSLVEVRRSIAALRRAKAQLSKDERLLASAIRLAGACGFPAVQPAPSSGDERPAEPAVEGTAEQSPVVLVTNGSTGEQPAALP